MMRVGRTKAHGRIIQLAKQLSLTAVLATVFVLSLALLLYARMHQSAVVVPRLIGKPMNQAGQLARTAGLTIKIKNQIRHDQYAPNTVVEQWPRPGMTIKRGQSVRVNVSTGPLEQNK
jgi:beta-lactam-binding protein with PASTA domain